MTASTDAVKDKAARYASAWSGHVAEDVSAHYAEDGVIIINEGDPIEGTAALTEMVSGFYAEFPDLIVRLDDIRVSTKNAIFVWTLEGHHAETKNFVRVGGWEQWTLNGDLEVQMSRGYFDAVEYERQIAEGI